MYDDYSRLHQITSYLLYNTLTTSPFYNRLFTSSLTVKTSSTSNTTISFLYRPPTSNTMDGDSTAKNFEQGANSALKENELSSGIHESFKQTVGRSETLDAIYRELMLGET